MSSTTNYTGDIDISSLDNIKFDFNSVIIGQNSGDKLYTSSSINNNLNVFIGINSGINADNISKTIFLTYYNRSKKILNINIPELNGSFLDVSNGFLVLILSVKNQI